MRAEIIAIGDELTTGQRLDTNTQWLAERLCECGIDPAFHTTVGDQLADHVAALLTAIGRADVVVSTGGLGPTADDLTRQAMARAAGVDLVRDESTLATIRELFSRRGREMPERNALQADFPLGAHAIPNEHGTAPGIDLTFARSVGDAIPEGTCRMFALPGVPAEMRPMWHAYVRPAVVAMAPVPRIIRHFRLKCFGVGESQLEAMLPDVIRRGREPVVGITVSDATITLRITTTGPDDATCSVAAQPTVDLIRETLGGLVYGEEDEELHDVVLQLLERRGQSLAVAEWGTEGLLGQWLASSASSPNGEERPFRSFRGSIVATDLAQIASWTSNRAFSETQLANSQPHDADVAAALASAAQSLFAADYGLGVAQFPPDPDRADAYLAVAMATPQKDRRLRFQSASHPAIRKVRAAKQALDALRKILVQESV